MGAVLLQEGHPIAFLSKAFSPKNALLSAYERELLAVVFAVNKWQHYLMSLPFVIKTDQQSLKYVLEHKLSTPFQQKWLSKLAGFDYTVEYKSGKENVVADALSRTSGMQLFTMAVSSVSSQLLDELKLYWQKDVDIERLIQEVQQDPTSHPHYKWSDGVLLRKGKLMVGRADNVQQLVLNWMHSSSQGGHSGVYATMKRIKTLFYWPNMKKTVIEFVKKCSICQKCKYDASALPGLLQPLPVPESVWDDITMDFIEGLPKSKGKEVILVVIDRMSKYAHFLTLNHPFTALQVAQLFLDNIFKLHGCPKTIVSDRDKVFTSSFWQELMRLQGVQLKMSTAYHPQTDGQSETPFEVMYGYPPPVHRPYIQGSSLMDTVDRSLQAREQMLAALKENLHKARNRMKQQADKHRSERCFEVGDWVYLKLQPYKQGSVVSRPHQKLATKYFGPYPVLKKVGSVAYTLQLPTSSRIHPTFHVSLLKKHLGTIPTSLDTSIPEKYDSDNQEPIKVPWKVQEVRTIKKRNAAQVQWLVMWKNAPVEEASWVDAEIIMQQFPNFDPWGQGSAEQGGIDALRGEERVTVHVAESAQEEGQKKVNEKKDKGTTATGEHA
ncbi:hypothetical protein DCAR_0934588 [Daucus carota subsp. sativus]|uniref:Integrase catalytic domain-containing protein n=1 Tax=Daucus carota subsp. sativus TaxID=79200 RepID=A0AAF0XW23_DAUCS|nr:hypothetical protein DCAR_0934588 [Daucus carota subsp. sativus]